MEEIWKDIKGYEGLYQVSNLGRVKSLQRYVKSWKYGKMLRKERFLSLTCNTQGYRVVGLRKNNETKQFKVHRLVGEAFIPNPENKPHIDHIIPVSDGGTDEVWNLRWCTQKENNNNQITKAKCDASKIGRKFSEEAKKKMSEARKGKAPSENARKANIEALSKKVYQYTLDDELVNIWHSTREAERNGFDSGNISKCCNGKYKTYKGYKWSNNPL